MNELVQLAVNLAEAFFVLYGICAFVKARWQRILIKNLGIKHGDGAEVQRYLIIDKDHNLFMTDKIGKELRTLCKYEAIGVVNLNSGYGLRDDMHWYPFRTLPENFIDSYNLAYNTTTAKREVTKK